MSCPSRCRPNLLKISQSPKSYQFFFEFNEAILTIVMSLSWVLLSMEEEDMLSQLPDEVRVSILSLLTVEEAVATSALSSQWRYFWMNVPCLNFDGPKLPKDLMGHSELCTKEVIRYINLVNRVLDLHKCPILQEFSVSFPFLESTSASAKSQVYNWLKFASSRKIRCLKLDFYVDYVHWPENTRLCDYVFPVELLFGLKTLKKLTLNTVDVDCLAVESILSSCPLLEFLSITRSSLLHHLKVVGPSLKLKHLVIWKCRIYSMEIRNVVNLVSFTFRGVTSNFCFKNVTSVLNIDINLSMYAKLYENAPRITTNFTQLVMLSLEGSHSYTHDLFGGSLPTFNYLKWLMLNLYGVDDSSLLRIAPLLEAAPYLQKFTIELHRYIKDVQERSISRRTVKTPHQHLIEVQYRGYLGDANDVELATYLLENTVVLEKFIVDPREDVKDIENCEETQRARDLAMVQLQPKVPKGVKLVII